MKIVKSINELKSCLQPIRSIDSSTGFVPTMGAIHDGHLSLVTKSTSENDQTVCSIFVNPAQFNNPSDFENYPNQVGADIEKLNTVNCDILFLPSREEIYKDGDAVKFDFGLLASGLEGEFRPGHFSGVGLIVAKLFNIVSPEKAYFGQKDLQQLAIVRKLVRDLNFPIDVIGVETKRDNQGLAMSSRNAKLNSQEIQIATHLYKSLVFLKKLVGEKNRLDDAVNIVRSFLKEKKEIALEYLEVVDSNTMERVTSLEEAGQVSACIAANVGGVRLIDNIYLKKQH